MSLVVELLDASGRAINTKLFSSKEISIGRDFSCDVIVTDPHADALHAKVSLDPVSNVIQVQDCDSINGTQSGRIKLRGSSKQVPANTVITIGKTRLKLCNSNLPVPAAKPLTALDRWYDMADKTLFCGLCILLLCGIELFDTWAHSTADLQSSQLIENLGLVLLIVGMAAAFWSLIGRIAKRRLSFRAHLAIASIGLCLVALADPLLQFILYNINSSHAFFTASLISSGLITVVIQFFHLHLATNLGTKTRLAILAMVFALYPGISLYKAAEQESDFKPWPRYNGSLATPGWQFHSTVIPDQLVTRSDQVFVAARQQVAEKKAEQEKRD